MERTQEEEQLTKNVDDGGSSEPASHHKTQFAGILHRLATVYHVRSYEVECVVMIVLH